MNEQLLKNISKYVKLSSEEKFLFKTFWTQKTLEKGDYLLRNGQTCRTDNYIITGTLKGSVASVQNKYESLI